MTRTSIIVFASLLVAPACVLEPKWGDEYTRRDPIDFSGMASKARATLRIQAWNHGTSTFDTVSWLSAGTTRYASEPDLYGWGRIGLVLADRYWAPGGDCRSTGMANLRVQELNSDGTYLDLATFGQDGDACIGARMAAGDHPVAAGNACKLEDETIVLFAPPQCVPARTTDATPPRVTVRLANSEHAYQRTNGEADQTVSGLNRRQRLFVTGLVRDVDGAVERVRIDGHYDLECRSDAGATWRSRYPLASTMTQPVTAGALTQIGVEVNRTIEVPSLVANCPLGHTFLRIAGTVFATGTNAAGTVVVSPRLTFSI